MEGKTITRLAAAGAMVGLLGFGSVQLASAQEEDPSSTTTEQSEDSTTTAPEAEEETPSTEDGSADREGCDEGGGEAPAEEAPAS